MFKRLYFALVLLFWLVMNVLLWRSEMGAVQDLGGPVPPAVVWEKMLTAPDDSSLQITVRGERAGYCRWAANVGEEITTGKTATEDYEPEGRVRRLTGYTIDLDGSLSASDPPLRLRFNWHATFGTNQLWRQMRLRLTSRPAVWEAQADAQAQTLTLRMDDGSTAWQRCFTFEELSRPETLVSMFGGGPLMLGWLKDSIPLPGAWAPQAIGLGLNWEARHCWHKIGHTQVKAYRLQARLFDKYQAVIIVSRVGEIFRVELPQGATLVNDALTNF